MRIADQILNRMAVLKAIRRNAPISRTELSTVTALSGGTITQLTADLLRRGLIVETRETAPQSWRPRTYLAINGSGGVVIGASIDGRGILTAAFVDLLGKKLFSHDLNFGPVGTLVEFARRIAGALLEGIDASPYAVADVTRIGISLPALVDSARGIVHYMTTFPAEPVPFAAIIAELVGVPVTIENDASCMARAEHWSGQAQQFETFTLLHVGYTIGSANYRDDLPDCGFNGANSEMGHVKVAIGADARLCTCGARGCLAAYSSIYGILSHLDLLAGTRFPPLETLDERFGQLLDRDDCAARDAIALAGSYLGMAAANHLNARDPGSLLILMSNERLLQRLRPIIDTVIHDLALKPILENTNIVFGVSNTEWSWAGTSALALEQTYLSEERLIKTIASEDVPIN